MWECDDIEHLNGPYADGGFTVYEDQMETTILIMTMKLEWRGNLHVQ